MLKNAIQTTISHHKSGYFDLYQFLCAESVWAMPSGSNCSLRSSSASLSAQCNYADPRVISTSDDLQNEEGNGWHDILDYRKCLNMKLYHKNFPTFHVFSVEKVGMAL